MEAGGEYLQRSSSCLVRDRKLKRVLRGHLLISSDGSADVGWLQSNSWLEVKNSGKRESVLCCQNVSRNAFTLDQKLTAVIGSGKFTEGLQQ